MQKLKFMLVGLILVSLASWSYAEEKKAVFDLTTGDSGRIETRIIQSIKGLSEYYKEQQVDFKAVVVISGKAYKYFIQDLENSPFKDDKDLAEVQKKFQPMLEELHRKYGVRFDMCGAGMKMRNIGADSLYPFVHSDKTKYVYLIDWQNEGYAYVPI